MLLILGVILGVVGAFYNRMMLKAQDLYKKPAFLGVTGRLVIAFLAAGAVGLVMPSVLGSGSGLIVSLTAGDSRPDPAHFCGEAPVLGSQFRVRSAGRHLLPAADLRLPSRRGFCHGGGTALRAGSDVYQ